MVRPTKDCIINESNLRSRRIYEGNCDVSNNGYRGTRKKNDASEYLPPANELHKYLILVRDEKLRAAAALFHNDVNVTTLDNIDLDITDKKMKTRKMRSQILNK